MRCPAPYEVLPTDGGGQLAWSSVGTGSPPLLVLPGWLSHVAADHDVRGRGRLIRAMAAHRRVVFLDRPGIGLSDRDHPRFALDEQVADLELLIGQCIGQPVAVFAAGLSGPVAIALAARHPESVSHLILFGSAPVITATPAWPQGMSAALVNALGELMASDWTLAASAMTDLLLPELPTDEKRQFIDYQCTSASGAVACSLLRAHAAMDVTPLLARVEAPTLVVHRRRDRAIGVAASRRLAGAILGAQTLTLEGDTNLPFGGCVEELVQHIEAFIDPSWQSLSPREQLVVTLAGAGLSNHEIAVRLGVCETTVARHLATVYGKLGVNTRGEAADRLRRLGLITSSL